MEFYGNILQRNFLDHFGPVRPSPDMDVRFMQVDVRFMARTCGSPTWTCGSLRRDIKTSDRPSALAQAQPTQPPVLSSQPLTQLFLLSYGRPSFADGCRDSAEFGRGV